MTYLKRHCYDNSSNSVTRISLSLRYFRAKFTNLFLFLQNSWSDSGTDASNANSSADVQFPSALLPLTIQHLDKGTHSKK